eukprot:981536_1
MSPQQNESTSNTLNAPISNDENANPNTNNTNNNKRERDDDESDDQPIPPPLKKRKTKADRRFDLTLEDIKKMTPHTKIDMVCEILKEIGNKMSDPKQENAFIRFAHCLFDGKDYAFEDMIPEDVVNGLAHTFRRYGRHLGHMIDYHADMDDDYFVLYLSHFVDINELQIKLTENALYVREELNVSKTVYNNKITKWYKSIRNMFYGAIDIYPPQKMIDKQFEEKMEWLKFKDIKVNDKVVGLRWTLDHIYRKQLTTSYIRDSMDWYQIVDKQNRDQVIIQRLVHSKVPTDGVLFRSSKRGNIATTFHNTCVHGTGLSYQFADIIALSNLAEGYSKSHFHQQPLERNITHLHQLGSM